MAMGVAVPGMGGAVALGGAVPGMGGAVALGGAVSGMGGAVPSFRNLPASLVPACCSEGLAF